MRRYKLTSDAERIRWSPDGQSFVASTEDGLVKCFDTRMSSSSHDGGGGVLWSLQAHAGACSGLDFCPGASDILATAGQDKMVKLWSVSTSGNDGAPTLVGRRNMGLGVLFDVRFSPDNPALLGAGGSKGKLGVWNTLELEGMQERLPDCQAALGDDGRVLSSAVAGMGALDVNSSEDEEDDEGSAMAKGRRADGGPVGKAEAASSIGEGLGGDDDDDDDDASDDDDGEDEDEDTQAKETDERQKQEEARSARVSAALSAAARKARRGKKVRVKGR